MTSPILEQFGEFSQNGVKYVMLKVLGLISVASKKNPVMKSPNMYFPQ